MTSANTPLEWWRPVPPPQPASVIATDGAAASPLSVFAFRALVTFAALNIMAPQTLIPALAPLRLALLAAGTAMGAYLIESWSGAGPKTPPPTELKLGVGLLVWAALTAPLSLWPSGSLIYLVDQFVKSIIVFWLLARVIRTVSQLHTIFWTLSLVTVPLAYVGVMQMRSGEMYGGRIVGAANSSLAANPNDLAMMVDVVLPLAFTVGLLARDWRVRLAAFGMVGLNLICLGTTYSRSGFLGLMVMVVAALVLAARRGKGWVIGVGVIALPIALAVMPSSYLERLSTIQSVESDDTGSSQERMKLMIAATEYMVEHPIAGAGLFQDVLAIVEKQGARAIWLHVHNAYLQVGADLGLPGLAMFLAMVIYGYRRVTRVEREALAQGRHNLSLMATGLKLSYLGLLTTLFFSPSAYNFPLYYLLGLVLALDAVHTASAGPAATAELARR